MGGIVQQECTSQHECLCRVHRINRACNLVSHAPQGIEMGNVVNSQFRKQTTNFADQSRCAISKTEKGLAKDLSLWVETVRLVRKCALPQCEMIHGRHVRLP